MSDLTEYLPLRADLEAWENLPFFPFDFASVPDDSLLDRLYWTGFSFEQTDESLSAEVEVAWEGTEEISLPLLNTQGIALVLGGGTATSIGLTVISSADSLRFELTTRIALRFDTTLIIPVVLENGSYHVIEEGSYEIAFENGTVILDSSGNLSFQDADTVTLAPFAVGDSGMIVIPGAVTLCFGEDEAAALMAAYPDAELTADFRGVFIADGSVVFPEDFPIESVSLRNAFIGNQGFTGTLQANRGESGLVERGACLGFPFTLMSIALTFVQNAISACGISGDLTIPFFQKTVLVDLSLGLDGALTIALSDPEGLAALEIEQVGTVTLTSLGFTTDDQGVGVLLSGSLLLSVSGLQWPEIILQGLCIRPGGEVSVPGGWIDLQTPIAVDLFGFRAEISALGFGNEADGRSWVGFSGGLHLIDLLPTGVSVEGLRIIWDPNGRLPVALTLQGVGIELTVPGAMSLSGDVALIEEGSEHYFTGNLTLEVQPIAITLDAAVKIGHDSVLDYNYVYIYLSLELPVGIPLWASGLALYGIAGLVGVNIEPGTENGDWYAWYAAAPEFDVVDSSKWRGALGGMAFGAGVVIGTVFDAAWTMSTKALFALILPGPVILFNGKANILQFPPGLLENSEASLNLLAVLDAQAGDFLFVIDAAWELKQVVDVRASAEAYFQFARPDTWHLYLGQAVPEERRIRAYVLSLFSADAYLMIDNKGIATGFGVSYGQDWRFGPVGLVMRAWIEAGAAITWQPPQLEGSLSVGGEFSIRVAGFSVGLAAEASLSGKAPKPYQVRGELEVRVNLPAPIKDLEENILLEWKQELPPDLENPLRSLSLEHLKVSETWSPHVSDSSLSPIDGEYNAGPMVPLDARPVIVFDRAVLDNSGLKNVNASYGGSTKIGDYSFDYELEAGGISLEMWSKAGAGGWTEISTIDGTWTAEIDGTGRASSSKLQLMVKTPFAFTRRTSRTYADWFLTANPNWPCADGAEATVNCIDWSEPQNRIDYGTVFKHGDLTFISTLNMWLDIAPRNMRCRIDGERGLAFHFMVWILFPEPVRRVEFCLEGQFEVARAYTGGTLLAQVDSPSGVTVLEANGIDWVELKALTDSPVVLSYVCYTTEAEAAAEDRETTTQETIEANILSWSSEDEVLPPDTFFRLKANVKTTRKHNGLIDSEQSYTQYAYFQTAAPPALTPENGTETETSGLQTGHYPASGELADLRTYIANLIPRHGQRAVYRAYSLGAEFNENYVQQMYGADVVIRLRDANDLPIRDEQGNEVLSANQWAELPASELSITEIPYISRVENCATISSVGIAANQTFIASYGVLFEEDFSGTLDAWNDVNESADGDWITVNGQVKYVAAILSPFGALLVAGDPSWQDYAVEAELSAEGDEVGLVFRYSDDGIRRYYRLRLNAAGRYFERISDSDIEILWQDSVVYTPATNQVVAVQCFGQRLRGQLGSELLFDIVDEEGFTGGQIGLYTNTTAAFERVLVREWPGAVLAAETLYRAELAASYVLFQADAWPDNPAAAGWLELVDTDSPKRRMIVIGQEGWKNYRLEVTFNTFRSESVGFLVRVTINPDETFQCYRLLYNPDNQSLTLSLLIGSYNFSDNTYSVGERDVLWNCTGANCGIDFNLTEHDLALTCDGDQFIIEIDGSLVAVVGDNAITSGKIGLYYNGIEAVPTSFADVILRSSTRGKIYGWQFSTSAYPGFVEHLDSFTGVVHNDVATRPTSADLSAVIVEAAAALTEASSIVLTTRSALAAASAAEFSQILADVLDAFDSYNRTSISYYESLHQLFFGSTYRPCPPNVELTELFGDEGRYALLLESPEPLDWNRLSFTLMRLTRTGGYIDISASTIVVWSNDGIRALLLSSSGAALPNGTYQLQLTFYLDIGAEAPVLRRNGSIVPETVALHFDLTN